MPGILVLFDLFGGTSTDPKYLGSQQEFLLKGRQKWSVYSLSEGLQKDNPDARLMTDSALVNSPSATVLDQSCSVEQGLR